MNQIRIQLERLTNHRYYAIRTICYAPISVAARLLDILAPHADTFAADLTANPEHKHRIALSGKPEDNQ